MPINPIPFRSIAHSLRIRYELPVLTIAPVRESVIASRSSLTESEIISARECFSHHYGNGVGQVAFYLSQMRQLGFSPSFRDTDLKKLWEGFALAKESIYQLQVSKKDLPTGWATLEKILTICPESSLLFGEQSEQVRAELDPILRRFFNEDC